MADDLVEQPARTAQQGDQASHRRGRRLPQPHRSDPPGRHGAGRAERRLVVNHPPSAARSRAVRIVGTGPVPRRVLSAGTRSRHVPALSPSTTEPTSPAGAFGPAPPITRPWPSSQGRPHRPPGSNVTVATGSGRQVPGHLIVGEKPTNSAQFHHSHLSTRAKSGRAPSLTYSNSSNAPSSSPRSPSWPTKRASRQPPEHPLTKFIGGYPLELQRWKTSGHMARRGQRPPRHSGRVSGRTG